MGRIDEAMRRTGGGAPTLEHDRAGEEGSAPSSPWVFTTDDFTRPAPAPRAPAPSPVEGSAVEEALEGSAVEGSAVEGHAESAIDSFEAAPGSRAEGRTLSGAEGRGELAAFRMFSPAVLDRLVVNGNASPALAEQFRKLAATLHHAQLSEGTKIIMVTSGMTADGKTLTATNLALTLSESYRREVLLIDADLRRPSLHEVFQVPNVSGLNEGLQAEVDKRLSSLQITDTLTLLPAGRPNADPMSSLTSERMRSIVDEAAARFDWVIIDTPPIGSLADANLLADMVDGALLVVLAGHTPYKVVNKAIEAIGRDRILGVVLNGARDDVESDAYYRQYGQ